jgi:CheY-like chemotaxis protein
MMDEDVVSDRILVVDDDPFAISLIKSTLADEPYEVFSALEGQDGIELLAEHDDIKVVISDENMPGMSGSEFLAQVKESFPFVVRILMTGLKLSGTAMRAVSSGEVFRIIKKMPWNSFDLKMNIYSAIEKYDSEVIGDGTMIIVNKDEPEPQVDGQETSEINDPDKTMDGPPVWPDFTWNQKDDSSG